MIEVSGVTKDFGRFTAVRDLRFAVAKGEVLGFLGPNGAGKTTTMRILTGFIPPTKGTATVAGHDILQEPLQAKRKTGYLPETPPLYPEMTVVDYLDFAARIKDVPRAKRSGRVAEVIDRCALGEVRGTLAGKLSKGYRQRVGLAQALIHDPEVLILDEPTAGLDPKQINETRELIRTLGGEHTVVLSTHILPEVAVTCDRVVIIHRGRVVAQGTAASLTERFRRGHLLDITVSGPEPEVQRAVLAVRGVARIDRVGSEGDAGIYRIEAEEGHDVRREVAASVVGARLGLLGLHQEGMSLEEVYLRVISSEEPGERGEPVETAGGGPAEPLEPTSVPEPEEG